MAGGKTRYVAHSAGGELKKLLTLAIKAARLTLKGACPLADDKEIIEDSESEDVMKAATFKKKPVITIHIGGHEISVMKIVPKCINKVAEELTKGANPERTTGAQPIHAKFQFADDACPLVPGKIHWEPQEHVWRLEFLNSQKKRTQPPGLQVDAALRRGHYQSAKAIAYENAKRKWNELDISRRPRIQVEGELEAQEKLEHAAQQMSDRWSRGECL